MRENVGFGTSNTQLIKSYWIHWLRFHFIMNIQYFIQSGILFMGGVYQSAFNLLSLLLQGYLH